MKLKIYNWLVNRKPGICKRYHIMHDQASNIGKIVSYFYLLWLNFAYYFLFMHFLGEPAGVEMYEQKKLECHESESHNNKINNSNLSVAFYIEKLKSYDVISFDIFDTLIFRPVGQPTDMFYFIGEKLGIYDFKNLRIKAETVARQKSQKQFGHMEVGLRDIWGELEKTIGGSTASGYDVEIQTELELCYANPFMLEVWNRLQDLNKDIIVVSDMYLPEEVLREILHRNGYTNYKKLYVSCAYKKNKATGSLFEVVKSEWKKQIIHVGDNTNSDDIMAKKHGIETLPYPNVNCNMQLYRPFDMSYLVGSAYRAMISNRLYNGLYEYSMEYEYGFVYGGLFVVGYCHFIHEYCKKNKIDTILFLSRDGDILNKTYQLLYPEQKTNYVYWSRKAATILMADENKYDYFRRFIYHKVNQGYSIHDILFSMQLEFLEPYCCGFIASDELTNKNVELVKVFIESHWEKIKENYSTDLEAARRYYAERLRESSKVAVVDIGWAGSGALALSYLVEKVWKMPCEIIGIIAGTNTVYNSEPDASEAFLQSGKLVAYLYSQSHNRDLLKIHNPNKDYNVFWELLLSSPTPQFSGFKLGNMVRESSDDLFLEKENITLWFGKFDKNQIGINQIQTGILDFASDYMRHFKMIPYMFEISGRDAYAPMLVAASNKEAYLKEIEKKFGLEINVN